MFKHVNKPSVLNPKDREQFVCEIFSKIACYYDWINSILSLNRDAYWRRFTVAKAAVPVGGEVIDVCCGTGKLTRELAQAVGTNGKVVGVDFCADMLRIAQETMAKTNYAKNVDFVEGNALKLPFSDQSFDCCTIGFGIRNVADIPGAINEMCRVLKPGGRLVILELGKPHIPVFRNLYYFYFEKILPLLGQALAKVEGAYQWLPESLRLFPDQQEVLGMMQKSGFQDTECTQLTGGIVAVYLGVKK